LLTSTYKVLVNNAGIALLPPKSPSSESGIDLAYLQELRESYNSTFNANITSVATITSVFLPLLHQSTHGKVINISSGRASLHNSTTGHMPPTAVVSYSVSKTGMNALTVEMQKTEDAREGGGKVEFYAANPGHCKTAFNGYRGTKDPKDGAEVVVRLV
jgi:NAD(P)-dependent dehydrogenase (short-subunit alcohol dehydrogenase family)